MQTIYVDFRKVINHASNFDPISGGGNYATWITKEISNRLNDVQKIVILIDKKTDKAKEDYLCTFFQKKAEFFTIDSLFDIAPQENDILFIPMLNDSMEFAKELENVKNKYKYLKVYITIFDRRHRETKIDIYDSRFKTGLRSNRFLLSVGKKMRSIEIEKAFSIIVRLADKIFTISNYSVQQLRDINGLKWIGYYYPTYMGSNVSENNYITMPNQEKYILFVSAGRPEKNFVRAVQAFLQYKNKIQNDIKLYATGMSERQVDALKSIKEVDAEQINKSVKIMGYVTDEELDKLYRNCLFLLFTSKNEGYGLPVMEAVLRGKSAVASNASAVPEVAGAAVVYVNPFSVKSIENGITFMVNNDNRKRYESYAQQMKKIILERGELDTQILIDTILY